MVIVGSATGEHYDITSSVVQGIIKSASVDGNVLTLTPFYGNPITFSKATSLSGGWSGGNYIVTAKQNSATVATHTYNPPIRLNGTTAASNFSAEIYETPSGGTPVARKSVYGYLISGGSGSGSYVDVNTQSNGSGSSVARISVGSVYTEGVSNGYGAGKADGRSEYKALVRTRFGSSSGGYYVEAYENNSGSASIPSSSISYKLALSGSTSSSKVQIQNTSGSKISNTPELSVGSLYTGGWDACYATRVFSATANSKTLSYGESVTVSASLKNSSGTTVSMGSRTYVAPADRYADGWNAGAATSGLIYVSDTTGYSDQGVLPFEAKIAPTYIDADGNRQIQKVFWRVPADSGGGGGDHSPAITEFTPGWTGNIGSRTKLKTINASDIKSRTYILLTASCGGKTKQYYIVVN